MILLLSTVALAAATVTACPGDPIGFPSCTIHVDPDKTSKAWDDDDGDGIGDGGIW